MWHEAQDIAEERERVLERPRPTPGVPLLDAFTVEPLIPAEEYAAHLRAVFAAALRLAVTEPFDGPLPTATLPSWFARADGPPEELPGFARAGREHFLRHPGADGLWEIQDWLGRFEPEDGIRGWAWWDVTRPAAGGARIWVNCEGEAHYSHLDLLWAAYVSGARAVGGPEPYRAAEWSAEPSLFQQ
ncbi:hypothetical protein [Streptomyces aidingensis]|uniref:Uncharacterized protein n=1 Tax=Streptomyces aidingensis TaxID=910347 RepID=A0A1I1HV42_9ACTN|nr:hypothetical protein [Streptomyces aidingensis]SFC27751.1 hypothetical protein SAMN05421773_102532 [Streptomyces aidingensis]